MGFLTSLIHDGDDDVTLRQAAHENVPIDVRIQSTLNKVVTVIKFTRKNVKVTKSDWKLIKMTLKLVQIRADLKKS